MGWMSMFSHSKYIRQSSWCIVLAGHPHTQNTDAGRKESIDCLLAYTHIGKFDKQ